MATRGRPLKFKSKKKLLAAGYAYFDDCIAKKKPITITGLCIALGTFRDVLIDYQNGKYDEIDDFSNTIKELKQVCENYAEEQVFIGKNQTGAIFALKNYGWRDTQQVEHSGTEGFTLNLKVAHGDKLDPNRETGGGVEPTT